MTTDTATLIARTGTRAPAIRRLTPAQLDAGRRRPVGTPDERANAVRAILDAPTFTVEPSPLRSATLPHTPQ
ncbi:hypothetical protein [Curtobacterium luteum]|uniref:Uncharacterized protein n=1 Tax=Curtobacterium luteum TaxID=33881 RepID=A0A175RQZ2_9MICO|nr:hypothetical protein [Curtobacterium luteum]KTR05219.1 hypothetical protein NS184_10635 [Curtobacterium luteum]